MWDRKYCCDHFLENAVCFSTLKVFLKIVIELLYSVLLVSSVQ